MTDETLWIVTASEISEEDTEGAKNPWNNTRGDGQGMIEGVAKLKQVSVQKLEEELSKFLRIVSGVFDRAENAIPAETGVKLAEIELSVEITGEGDIKLLGTGIKAGTKGGLTLKFKKDQRILLPQQATAQDLVTLTLEAVNAEGEEDFELAISLIRRVLAISPSAMAWQIHDRIFRKMHNQQVPFSKGNSGDSPQETNFTEDLGNGVKLEMVYILAGKFMMGSNESEYEKPIHKVTFKQGFYMGKYPITQAQYQAIMGKNPAQSKGENKPVERVSWHDAQEFCQKLSEKTRKKYKLPSESQWEYACRAGSTTRYCFGDNAYQLSEYAWYGDNSGDSWLDSLKIWETDRGNYYDKLIANKCSTHPVGEKQPNAWGLYDMHGNVWEWCEDDWHENYEDAPDDGTAWIDKSSEYVVLRGGSWLNIPNSCRSAFRGLNDARVSIIDYNGFRVVCVLGITL